MIRTLQLTYSVATVSPSTTRERRAKEEDVAIAVMRGSEFDRSQLRERLLKILFPDGLPRDAAFADAAECWLDGAERLATNNIQASTCALPGIRHHRWC